MKKNFFTDFLLCGLTGWCMECLWTGFKSLCKHDNKKLPCSTSIWMFPIYGLAAFIRPASKKLKNHGTFFRGMFYATGIFCIEYFSGSLLKKHNCCPWDYSKAKFNIKGVIRIDYLPAWFLAGLLFEKILNQTTDDCANN